MEAETKKRGRRRRNCPQEQVNLLIATKAKRRAFEIAMQRGISLGRLFEYLIEHADGDPYRGIIGKVRTKEDPQCATNDSKPPSV
jgi:hypothetical protein